MRAMILAAGRGERLRPLTDHLPKPLAPIGDRPLLAHQIGWLVAGGIQDIVINLHHLGDQIEAAFGDGSSLGARIRYSHEEERLETGGGIVKALPLLSEAPFLLLNGDIYTDFPFVSLARPLPETLDAHLVLTPRPAVREHGDFELTGNRITARGEPFVWCGIGVLHPRLFAGRRAEPFSLRELLFAAMADGRLGGEIWPGYWLDIGTPDQLATADRHARSQPFDDRVNSVSGNPLA